MAELTYQIRAESDRDYPLIVELHDEAFGPGRFAKTAYRIREANRLDPRLCFVASREQEILASVWYSPIFVGKVPAQLLGPLTVKPEFKNRGLGKALLRHSLEEARKINEESVLLVGDESYYGEFGFKKLNAGELKLPGPVDPDRLLLNQLGNNSKFEQMSGVVRGRRIDSLEI